MDQFIQLGQEAIFIREHNSLLIGSAIDDKLEKLFVALLKTLEAVR